MTGVSKYGPKRRLAEREVAEALAAAAERYCTTVKDIKSQSHFREHVLARRDVICVLRALNTSTCEIARVLGVHHTTVLYALRMRALADAERATDGRDAMGGTRSVAPAW